MTLDPRAVARALGGSVSGRHIIAPGPGHSRADRSLSIEIDPSRAGRLSVQFVRRRRLA